MLKNFTSSLGSRPATRSEMGPILTLCTSNHAVRCEREPTSCIYTNVFTWDIRKAIANFEKHRAIRYGERTMAKKPSASSARGRQVAKSGKRIPDRDIDTSDIPEMTDDELRRARRVGRPKSGVAKQLIAIRLSPRLLVTLRKMAAKQGKPYQSLIHELLEKAASRAA